MTQSLRPGAPARLSGINGSLLAFAAAHLFEERKTQMMLVVPEIDRAEQLRDDCAALLGDSCSV